MNEESTVTSEDEEFEVNRKLVRCGGFLVILPLIILVVFSALSVRFSFVANPSPFFAFARVIRFLLTIALGICVYQGREWARQLFMGLLALSVVFATVAGFVAQASDVPEELEQLKVISIIIFFSVAAASFCSMVIFSGVESVTHFLAHQRWLRADPTRW